MTRVLLAVDETQESVEAARRAHQLFGDTAEYLALSVADVDVEPALVPWWGPSWGIAYPVPYGTVWPYRVSPGAPSDERAEEPRQAVAAVAEYEARAQLERSGMADAEALGEIGDPVAVILETAHDRVVDVIVVGSHQRGWLDRLFHPSVSAAVVRKAEIPVLVIK